MIQDVLSEIVLGILIGSVYSLIGLGCVVIYKCSKVVSFTQGGFLLMGGIIAWFLLVVVKLPSAPAIVFTLVGCALLGLAVERFTLRPVLGQPLLASVMITVALLWFLDSVGFLVIGGPGRVFPRLFPSGFVDFFGIRISEANALSFAAAIVLFIGFTLFYKYTKIGLAMRATAEDHEVVQSLGVKVTNIFSITWAIAGLTAGIGGILMASLINLDVSLSMLGWKGLIVILIAGLESLPGVIIMGPVIGVLEILSINYIDPLVGGGMRDIAPFILMMLVLVIKPYGLFGLKRIERV